MGIRKFKSRDADAVSELIIENLRTVNIRDYSKDLIDILAAYKTPKRVIESAGKGSAFVAVKRGNILGVAMLKENKIVNMFVRKQMQGNGIGRSLLNRIEKLAKKKRISELVVDASITAVGFYSKCGYKVVRKVNKPFCSIDNVVFEMTKKL
jgi:N-acetylglutamate synthase-like GNAT family acetyltransferase